MTNSTSPVALRFAPSPTGYLQLGNIRIALYNWLYAKQHGGTMLLRFDDTDQARSKDHFITAAQEDLKWLGLTWDKKVCQSESISRYQTVVETLKASGKLYPCFETPEELALQRRIQRQRGRPPIYNRASLDISKDEIQARLDSGARAHWRLCLDFERVIVFDDLFRGRVSVPLNSVSDPVLIREDGQILYTLSSVIDDVDHRMTMIVRGEDHVVNTAVQMFIFETLVDLKVATDFQMPKFAHISLILGEDGKPLSKRDNSLAIKTLREEGFEPETIVTYLTALGGNLSPIDFEFAKTKATNTTRCLDKLVEKFDFGYYGRNAPRFEYKSLSSLNRQRLSLLPYEAICDRLEDKLRHSLTEQIWMTIRGEIVKLVELEPWLQRFETGQHYPSETTETINLITQAHDIFSPLEWNLAALSEAIKRLPKETGHKPGIIFRALRYSLIGLESGPALADLLLVLGKEESLTRLSASRA